MDKKKYLVPVSLLLLVFLFGCSQAPAPAPPVEKTTETIKVFYGDSGNEKFVMEEREISYSDQQEKYRVALEELIKGPNNETLQANISKDTKVYGTIKQDDALIVDLSEQFARFGGSVAEIIGVGSVVNTLTQFEEIKRVKILVEGEELVGPSGQPRGFMEPFPEDPNVTPQQPSVQDKEVTLYFANENADAVKAETRTIQVNPEINSRGLITVVLGELIKGPKSPELHRTIPEEVRVKSVQLNGEIAHVDFSQEMHTKHWGGAAGEAMTINSIANTLTEFEFVKKVKMTVEGQPMNIEHAILTEPVGRNEAMIEK